MSRSVKHYQAHPRDDEEVVIQLKQLAETYPRWGFNKMAHWLRLHGFVWNRKRIYGVYRAMKLNFHMRRTQRLPKRFP